MQHRKSTKLHILRTENSTWQNKSSFGYRLKLMFTWTAYRKLKEIFDMEIPLNLKTELYNQCILPEITYGTDIWVLTTAIVGIINQ